TLYRRFVEIIVAIAVEQTVSRGKETALPIGFDTAALELVVDGNERCLPQRCQLLVDAVVERGIVFVAPTVELEVEQSQLTFATHRHRTIVTAPGIVVRHTHETWRALATLAQLGANLRLVRCVLTQDQGRGTGGNGRGQFDVILLNLLQPRL